MHAVLALNIEIFRKISYNMKQRRIKKFSFILKVRSPFFVAVLCPTWWYCCSAPLNRLTDSNPSATEQWDGGQKSDLKTIISTHLINNYMHPPISCRRGHLTRVRFNSFFPFINFHTTKKKSEGECPSLQFLEFYFVFQHLFRHACLLWCCHVVGICVFGFATLKQMKVILYTHRRLYRFPPI